MSELNESQRKARRSANCWGLVALVIAIFAVYSIVFVPFLSKGRFGKQQTTFIVSNDLSIRKPTLIPLTLTEKEQRLRELTISIQRLRRQRY